MPQRQMHREVFFAHNGPGPYECFGCEQPLEFEEEFAVHHIDCVHENNTPENLAAIHVACHTRLHRTGVVASDETRQKISHSGKGRVNSPEHRAAISKAGKTRIWSAETRAKISVAHKGRRKTADHKLKIANTLKSQVTPESRARLSMIGTMGADARWGKDTDNGLWNS